MNPLVAFPLESLPHEAKIQVLVNASESEYRLFCLLDPMKALCNDEQTVNRIFQDKCQNRFSADTVTFKPRDMSWKDFYYHFEAFYQIFRLGRVPTFSDVQNSYSTLIPFKDHLKDDDIAMKKNYLTNPNMMNLLAFYGLTNEIRFMENLDTIRPTQIAANYAAGKGHLDTLKYLHEQYNFLPNEEGFLWAAESDQVQVIQWLEQMEVRLDDVAIDVAMGYACERNAYNILRYFIQKGYKLEDHDLMQLIMDDTSPNFTDSAEFINTVENKLIPGQILFIVRDLSNRTKKVLNLFHNNGYTFDWNVYANDMLEMGFNANQMNCVRNWFISKGLPVE